MNKNFEILFYFFGAVLLLFTNEYTLKFLFSNDNILESNSKNLIRIFNFITIIFYLLFFLSLSVKKYVRFYIINIFNFFNELRVIIKNNKNIFIFICILFFSIQIISITIKIYNNTSYFDVLKAEDMDAWDYAKITDKSRIYKNHKMLVYGPVYPKVSKILKIFISDKYSLDKLNNEKLVLFSLNFLNILSILFISYLISIIFTSRLKDKIFFSFIFFNSFLLSSLWAKSINIIRVDIFFSAVVCLIALIKVKSYLKKSNFLSYFSYFLGGLAINIKTLYVFFLPGLAIYELSQKKKFTHYILCLIFFLIGFLIFGLPESIFNFEDRLIYINKIRNLILGFTSESISYWLINFFNSCLPMIFVLFILNLLSENQKINFTSRDLLQLLIIIIFPFIYYSKKVLHPMDHYILPITIFLFVIISYRFNSSKSLKVLNKKILSKINPEFFRYIILILFIFLSYSDFNKFNFISAETYKQKIINEKNYDIVNKLSINKKVLVDAYVPFDSSNKNIKKYGHLMLNHAIVDKFDPEILIINSSETELLLDKNKKDKYSLDTFYTNYEERYNFYEKLYYENNFNYQNKRWKLIYKDKIIIWEIK